MADASFVGEDLLDEEELALLLFNEENDALWRRKSKDFSII
jgi:hypothetical protein